MTFKTSDKSNKPFKVVCRVKSLVCVKTDQGSLKFMGMLVMGPHYGLNASIATTKNIISSTVEWLYTIRLHRLQLLVGMQEHIIHMLDIQTMEFYSCGGVVEQKRFGSSIKFLCRIYP